MAMMKGTFAAVLMTLVWMGVTEGGPVTTTTTTTAMPLVAASVTAAIRVCPPLLFVAKEGHCVFVNEKIKDRVLAEYRKRVLITPSETCPFCATGVFDAYPDWSNCGQFNYCLDGRIIPLRCQDLGARFFNPALKACELFNNPNNMCLHRTVSLPIATSQG